MTNNEKSNRIIESPRSEIEICAKILEAAMNEARKTHMAYNAKINLKKMNKCLERLKESGLITGPKGKNNLYKTTKKGKKYLESFSYIRQMKESLNEL